MKHIISNGSIYLGKYDGFTISFDFTMRKNENKREKNWSHRIAWQNVEKNS